MEIKLPRPSELVNCENIASCFQAFYNLFFAILILLAFVYFIYGALQYLLSGAKVYSKEEGKKKIINSVVAVILALVIPIILNMINPGIFKAQLRLPVIKIEPAIYTYYGEAHTITDPDCPTGNTGNQNVKKICRFYYVSLSSVGFKKIQAGSGVCANLQILPYLCSLDKVLSNPPEKNIEPKVEKIEITSGYSKNHDNACHKNTGMCVDIVLKEIPAKTLKEACPYFLVLKKYLQSVVSERGVLINPTFETIGKGEEPKDKCKDVTETKCYYSYRYEEIVESPSGVSSRRESKEEKHEDTIQWKWCPKTTGTHLHVGFSAADEKRLNENLNITKENGEIKEVQCKQ